MVEADQRTGFREPISLEHDIAQLAPELLSLLVECRAPGDDGPELPTQHAMDPAEAQPAEEEMFFFGIYELVLQVGEVVLDLPAHRLDHSRHRDQYPSALAPDCGEDLRRLQTLLENHRPADQRGSEHSPQLSTDEAERHHLNE